MSTLSPVASAVADSGRRTRAVLFDVDGTLYHQPPLRACMAAELALSSAVRPLDRTSRIARVLRAYRAAHEQLRGVAANGEPVRRLQIAAAAARAGVTEREVEAIADEWMVRRPLKYLRWFRRSGLIPLLADLRRSGRELGVLSDYPARQKLAGLGVDTFFSQVLCSTDRDINALKPDPRGFWRACELWNLSPDEVLYVGDRPDVDAPGALAAGLRCAVIGNRRTRNGPAAGAGECGISRLGDLRAVV
jgi:HAD superfamily hydrolase (TIGR01549 family)